MEFRVLGQQPVVSVSDCILLGHAYRRHDSRRLRRLSNSRLAIVIAIKGTVRDE